MLKGPNSSIYSIRNPLREYIVTKPEIITPVVHYNSFAASWDSITIDIYSSEASTVYWFVQSPQGGTSPTFTDIKNKKIKQDYYSGFYLIGEQI